MLSWGVSSACRLIGPTPQTCSSRLDWRVAHPGCEKLLSFLFFSFFLCNKFNKTFSSSSSITLNTDCVEDETRLTWLNIWHARLAWREKLKRKKSFFFVAIWLICTTHRPAPPHRLHQRCNATHWSERKISHPLDCVKRLRGRFISMKNMATECSIQPLSLAGGGSVLPIQCEPVDLTTNGTAKLGNQLKNHHTNQFKASSERKRKKGLVIKHQNNNQISKTSPRDHLVDMHYTPYSPPPSGGCGSGGGGGTTLPTGPNSPLKHNTSATHSPPLSTPSPVSSSGNVKDQMKDQILNVTSSTSQSFFKPQSPHSAASGAMFGSNHLKHNNSVESMEQLLQSFTSVGGHPHNQTTTAALLQNLMAHQARLIAAATAAAAAAHHTNQEHSTRQIPNLPFQLPLVSSI